MGPPVNTCGSYRLSTSLDTRPEAMCTLEKWPPQMPRLTFESTVFKIINAKGLRPKLLDHAYRTPYQETQSYSYMVTEKLGSNLETLVKASGGSFTVSTTTKLAINLGLHLVESFHDTGFIHGEIKPDNIVVGIGPEADKLFPIDLELAAKCRDSHQHISYSTNVSFVGNPNFASNSKVLGKEVSRRDDLYSIGLMLTCFLRRSLPWSRVLGRRGSLCDNSKQVKPLCIIEVLTSMLPCPVMNLLGHSLALPFEARPDYEGMRQLFQQFNAHMDWDDAVPYDWLRSGQIVSPVAVSQEQGISAQGVPASCGANMQDENTSSASHSHNVVSMMQVASCQGISADEGTAIIKGTLAPKESTVAKEEGTAANKPAPASESTPKDETPPQSCEVEAKQPALPQTDAHQTDREEATCVAREVSRQRAEESASQVPSDPLPAAGKALESVGTETTPTAKNTCAFPQQSALGATTATVSADSPRQPSADRNDPKDPYSISFKLQPWLFKTLGL